MLGQSYPHFEIIVVDDGSQDDVKAILTSYPSVRYVRQSNQGLSAARNTGLNHINGTYVLSLDADDRLLPDAFETLTNVLEARPDVMFVSGQVRFIDKYGKPIPLPAEPLVDRDHYLALLRFCYIWTSGCVMFRREVFDTFKGYNPSLMATGDWDLYLRVARDFPIQSHSAVVLQHRRHDKNMTLDVALMLKESLVVLRSQRKYVRHNSRYRDALNSGFQGVYDYYGKPLVLQIRDSIKSGYKRRAFRDLWILMRWYPKGFRQFTFGLIRKTPVGDVR